MFTSFMCKVNKFNKVARRVILVTEANIYKLDPTNKFKPMKKGWPIAEV